MFCRAAHVILFLLVGACYPHAGAAPLGGDFTLQSEQGPVKLSDFRGKVVPVYFGYMSCPDICPMTLSALGAALRQLGDVELLGVQGLFVSIDPERDNPERLSEFARHFHPRILGVTGSPAEIEEITSRYRIAFARGKEDSTGFYTVDHTSRLVLVGPDGAVVRIVPDGTPPLAIAESIRQYLPR